MYILLMYKNIYSKIVLFLNLYMTKALHHTSHLSDAIAGPNCVFIFFIFCVHDMSEQESLSSVKSSFTAM